MLTANRNWNPACSRQHCSSVVTYNSNHVVLIVTSRTRRQCAALCKSAVCESAVCYDCQSATPDDACTTAAAACVLAQKKKKRLFLEGLFSKTLVESKVPETTSGYVTTGLCRAQYHKLALSHAAGDDACLLGRTRAHVRSANHVINDKRTVSDACRLRWKKYSASKQISPRAPSTTWVAQCGLCRNSGTSDCAIDFAAPCPLGLADFGNFTHLKLRFPVSSTFTQN